MKIQIQLLVILIFLLSSCGPTKQQKQALIDQSYNKGYSEARVIYYKLGVSDGKKKERSAIQNAKIRQLVIAGIKTNLPEILIITGSMGIITIVFGIFNRLFYRRMVNFLANYIRERSWEKASSYNGIKSLNAKKKKWSFRRTQVEAKMELRGQEIDNNQNHITKFQEYLTKGVPASQVDIMKDEISRFQSNILWQEQEILKGQDHVVKINEIQNWLDACIYKVKNSEPFDERKADLSKTDDSIKEYLNDEIGRHEFDYFIDQIDNVNEESLQIV